ncbi:Long-chain-fatty-acid--CoA ligase [hydrothermal vent metagenome]|uniref:Long-chain-fatty-acid--CoA ligase n=1 Tax=hydrothermal vent metagenome TaxID=652676 RepID=A0A3B1BFQ9_9ZZZZ
MCKTIIDMLSYQIEHFPQEDAICGKEDGVWKKYSAQESQENIDQLSYGLLEYGIQPGDKIAIISNNRPEYNFVDLACLQIKAVDVPIYPSISEKEYEFIFNQAEIKIVFLSSDDILQKVKNIQNRTPALEKIYTFNKIENAAHWSEIKSKGNPALHEKLKELKDSIVDTDLASIIYTSGTTGEQKGVMLSHKNIVSNIMSCIAMVPHGKEDKALSFLPLCHIFERTLTYFYMRVGVSIYYAENLDKIVDNLQEIKPQYFNTVPRLLEKLYEIIVSKGRSLTGLKKSIFFWAINLGLDYDVKGENSAWYNLKLAIARKLVFVKWQEALGGNIKGIVTGAAALQPRLAKIFNAAGIKVRQGYGLTETSPVLTVNLFEDGGYHFDSVGPVIPNVEIKIAENGEVLAKGDNVMIGYYKRPEITKTVIDEDGWFHTGDVGEFIDGKFLKITDRLKEIFKTSGGKYVAPQPIENKMMESFFIDQIMVIGENRRFPAALVIPAFPYVRKWCELKNIKVETNEDIVNNPQVYDRIWEEIEEGNKDFGKTRQIKKIKLLADAWSVDTGELTPTQKLKRKVIKQKYADIIDEIYAKDTEENNK